jgi:hypothetical protein
MDFKGAFLRMDWRLRRPLIEASNSSSIDMLERAGRATLSIRGELSQMGKRERKVFFLHQTNVYISSYKTHEMEITESLRPSSSLFTSFASICLWLNDFSSQQTDFIPKN